MKIRERKVLAAILSLVMLICAIPASSVYADEVPGTSSDAPDPPDISAEAAVVMDYDTGEFLYVKDPDTMRCPASMTKIMTAYIIFQELEAGNITWDTQFTISQNAKNISRDSSYPTSVPLVGDSLSLDTLLKLILIPSASACCIVAAENISGSEAAFVERMNATAQELGMDAHYENCHGARVHYVSARAIAILVRAFISQYPDVLNYTSLPYVTYNGTTYSNTNKLLSSYYYPGVDGFKTGTLTEAGYCLTATAMRDGRRVITVVMHASDNNKRHTDSQKLLDYGFEEIARRDAARASTDVSFNIDREEMRVGVAMDIHTVFSGVSTPYEADLVFSIGDYDLAAFHSFVWDGMDVLLTVALDDWFRVIGHAEFYVKYSMPDGGTRVLSGSLPVSSKPAPVFSDIPWHDSEDVITALYLDGWLSGYSDGTFRPDYAMTRAEFISAALKPSSTIVPSDFTVPFSDIAGHWAFNSICDAAYRGAVVGSYGQFHPDAPLTREEAATIVGRLLNLYMPDNSVQIADIGSVSIWARDCVKSVTEAGIFQCDANGDFRPGDYLTRAEGAEVLSKILAFIAV